MTTRCCPSGQRSRRSRCPKRSGRVSRRGAPVRLPSRPDARARAHLHRTRVAAEEMERVGLTPGTHAADRLMLAAHELAGRIAACGPLAIRGAKRIVNVRTESGFKAARELSDALRHALDGRTTLTRARRRTSRGGRRASPAAEARIQPPTTCSVELLALPELRPGSSPRRRAQLSSLPFQN